MCSTKALAALDRPSSSSLFPPADQISANYPWSESESESEGSHDEGEGGGGGGDKTKGLSFDFCFPRKKGKID